MSKPEPPIDYEPPLTREECFDAFEELRGYIASDRIERVSDRTLFIALCEWGRLGLLGGKPPALPAPIDMILFCPSCGLQHIDAPDPARFEWVNQPHRTHLCASCGHLWRPADVPTNGVLEIITPGSKEEKIRIRGIARSVSLYKADI